MDVREARRIADQVLGNGNERIGIGDSRMSAAAMALTDLNHDFRVDRDELVDALVADRVKHAGGKIIPANAVNGLSLSPRSPEDSGLRPTPWMQGAFLPGGDPANPPAATDIISRQAPDGTAGVRSSLNIAEVEALKGQDFATVAAAVRTPEDVAWLLDRNIDYDYDRLSDSEGNLGSWSSAEVLSRGNGVCRDQHALARDILQSNGYNAVLLGYAASDQSHAITAYQDPNTGKWGVLEYGTVYPPSQLNANSPEEALLMVRPSTMSISVFSDNGPNERSHVTGVIYTPNSRVIEQFAAGPSPDAGTGVTATNRSLTANVQSADRRWQAGMRVITDPHTPALQGAVMVGAWHNFNSGFRVGVGGGYAPNMSEHIIGNNREEKQGIGFAFVSAEEFHPELLQARDIGGSGINLTVGSHTRLQAVVGTGHETEQVRDAGNNPTGETRQKTVADIPGFSLGASSAKWNPTLTLDRRFDVNGDGRSETRAFATYGLGVDLGLLGAHYATGGRSFPINQYVTGGVETRPTDWLSVKAEGYVPIQNVTNDFAASPMARLEVATPYLRVGTTQGRDQASYDVSSSLQLGQHAQVGAFARIDHDRRSGVFAPTAGVQFGINF